MTQTTPTMQAMLNRIGISDMSNLLDGPRAEALDKVNGRLFSALSTLETYERQLRAAYHALTGAAEKELAALDQGMTPHDWATHHAGEVAKARARMDQSIEDVNMLAPIRKALLAAAERPTIEVTRDQLEDWAGRELTDDEVAQIDDCVPNSSIPEAIGAIATQFEYAEPRGDEKLPPSMEDEAKAEIEARGEVVVDTARYVQAHGVEPEGSSGRFEFQFNSPIADVAFTHDGAYEEAVERIRGYSQQNDLPLAIGAWTLLP